jgi:preprotein translocase subunit SecE
VAKKGVARAKKPNAIVRYFRETSAELRKVNWPTRKEALQLTVIVLIVVGAGSAFLGLLDYAFSKLFAMLIGLG